MTVDNEINGSLLKIKRESLGWTLADMAARACLSTKQVRQLEEGGDNSFYSHAIKLTVAKKIAQILQISEDELFNRSPLAPTATEFDAPTLELDIEHLDHTESSSSALSQNLLKISESETKNSPPSHSATVKDAQESVSFASILTRSQSPSNDLDELLAHEDSADAPHPNADHTEHHLGTSSTAKSLTSTTLLSESTPEGLHSETVGVPSSPSPITLSSASSSLSEEDQNNNDQSIWAKVILGILVLIGALLIVAPKSFEGLADWVELRFKRSDATTEASTNNNVSPTSVPALDATQSDTPVELAKPSVNGQESTKPLPSSTAATAVTATVPAPVVAPAPVSTQQSSNASIPTTAVPSVNPSLGAGAVSNPKPQSPAAPSSSQPVAPSSNGQ